jgi:hypothetical protein
LPADPALLDAQAALLAGLAGLTLAGDGEALPAPTPPTAGANQAVMLEIRRMSGLTDHRAAYETGRVLHRIAILLDAARAPAAIGRQFRDNVAGAVMTHRMRGRPEPWGAEDTVAMFMDLYGRMLGTDGEDYRKLEAMLLRFARGEPAAV